MTRYQAFAAAIRVCALVAGAGLCLTPTPPLALEASDPVPLETLTLTIGAQGAHPQTHAFQVEVMRTEEGRERGLMGRRYLPADRGMLFDFGREEPVLMWMKNTYIPLDMIFISRAGVITHIAEDAEPLSEAIISSQGAAYGVLEVNAGVARKLGLKPGDLVRHPMFGR